MFIYNTVNPFDWYTNVGNHNDALWSDGEGKSAYDPCPEGWRVPGNGTWKDFTTTTMPLSGSVYNNVTGRLYNKIAWYPCVGYLYCKRGEFVYVGSYAQMRSRSVSGTYAIELFLNTVSVNGSYAYNRGDGDGIRCIQE